ncbi:MAG: Fe-S cluster assembly sulfur transfer protein SufU [Verrucomicrobiota bacterium]
MPELEELYQSIILDHNKQPRNYGALTDATHQAEGYNKLCGDKVEVYLKIRDERIEAIRFESASCAICNASASMMTQALVGKTLQEAAQVQERVRLLLSEDVEDFASEDDLVALQGVRQFPSRINCALLPWQTLRDAYEPSG